jgi:hypothetical protein
VGNSLVKRDLFYPHTIRFKYYIVCLQFHFNLGTACIFSTPFISITAELSKPSPKEIFLYPRLPFVRAVLLSEFPLRHSYFMINFIYQSLKCCALPAELRSHFIKELFVCLNRCKVTNNFSNLQMFYKLFFVGPEEHDSPTFRLCYNYILNRTNIITWTMHLPY